MLQNISVTNKCCSSKKPEKKLSVSTKNKKQFLTCNVSWAGKQHIRMISEGSCDTEDWSNDAEKFSFASQE